eukprot:Em0774g1a
MPYMQLQASVVGSQSLGIWDTTAAPGLLDNWNCAHPVKIPFGWEGQLHECQQQFCADLSWLVGATRLFVVGCFGHLLAGGVSTGFLLQSKSLYNSVCERDQLRTFRKLGASSEKQSDHNSQSVVPRGAFEHPISGPGDMAAAHNLVSGSQSYHSRPGSCPIPATDAMVLPRSHFSVGAPPLHAETHPSDSVVSVGERVEFTCKAIVQGSWQKPRYVWCKDNQPLVWEIGQHCVVESACAEDAGEYLCLVSDPQGHVTVKSWAARLTAQKPTFLPGLQPMDLPSDDRQSTVKPLRSGPPLKEEPISQAFLLSLASTVSVQRCSPLRLGSYLELTSQEVADITHQVMSDEERTYFMLRRWVERKGKGRSTLLAILKKAGMCVSNTTESEDTPKLQIHVDPQNPICYGNSVTLRVLTNHTPNHHHLPLGYQWYKDGRPLERRRSRELSIHSFTEGDCGVHLFCDHAPW